MRRLLAILLVLGMTACQAPPSLPMESSAPPPDSLDPELYDLFYNWFSANIDSHCGAASSGTAERDVCIKTMLLTAFDESGDARQNCPLETELGQFGECVVYGSFAQELLTRRDPGMALDVDWLAPRSSISLAFDTIADTATLACFGSDSLDVCYRQQMADSLGLSGYSTKVCGSIEVDDWKRCMLREYVSNELLEASARI